MGQATSTSLSRRGFLLGAAIGGVTGAVAGAGVLGLYRQYQPASQTQHYPRGLEPITYVRKQFTGKSVEVANPALALPGPFPGRVIEIHDPQSVVHGAINPKPVKHMLDRGMKELTGAADAVQAWQRFFKKGERVGIKVNPVGFSRRSGIVGVISSFPVIMAIIDGLKTAGIPPKDVILFERYASEFREAGYEKFVERELPGVKWYASAVTGGNVQIDLEGRDLHDGRRRDPDPHVVGYDEAIFRKLDYKVRECRDSDPLSYESHVSRILTDEKTVDVQKIITIPLLKDHRSAGITIALKNMSHGMASNVARTHIGPAAGENHCGTFTPQIVELAPFRRKCVLHIMDALICNYEGGPGSWNNSWGTWEGRSLFFATDPVALDHVGWDILDAERAQRGWAPVARMGVAGNNRSGTEAFHLRQPEHVTLAGLLGLGVFDPARIEYRTVRLTS
jgi:uncharacterized protein (DUF362 family)